MCDASSPPETSRENGRVSDDRGNGGWGEEEKD